MPQCSQCGAHVSRRDKVCSYCGTPNPAYEPPVDEVNQLLENGLHAYQQGHYALAIENYRQAIEQDPDVFDAYFYLTASLSALGRDKEAIDVMKKARRIRPGSATPDYNLGLLYRRIGKSKEARRSFEEALKKVDRDPALQNRAEVKQKIRQQLGELKRWTFW